MTEAVSEPVETALDERGRSLPSSLPGVAIIVVTVVWAFVVGRHLWFFSDDWNIIASYHSGHLLEPFNSHLSLVPVGIYQVLFHTFGLDSYVPFRIVGLIAYAVLGWVTWRFALARLGRAPLGIAGAALATAAVLWNSGGVTNVMFPFLMNFSLPVAALAAIWWHLDRSTTRHDLAASAWLILALATSGLGLMTAVAIGVELVWVAVGARRIDWRRWATLAPGPVLWLAWYVKYGVDSPASGGLRPVISYAVRMMLGGFASLGGGSWWIGCIIAAFMAGLIGGSIIRRTFDGRLLGALAAPLAFSVLTAISRIGVVPAIPPDELRYRWTIGAFLVFAFVLLLAANADGTEQWRQTGIRTMVGLATLAVVANAVGLVGDVGDWDRTVETAVPGVRANLWVAEAAQRAGVLDRSRNLPVSYVQVTAGEYVDAVAALGSPLAGFGRRSYGGSLSQRHAAAQAFVDDFDIAVTTDGPADCRPKLASTSPLPFPVAAKETVAILAMDGPVEVRMTILPPDGTSGDDSVVIGTVAAGEQGFVTMPAYGSDVPVTPTLEIGSGSVSSCP